MLIGSPRHRPDEVAAWRRQADADPVHASLPAFWRRVARSKEELLAFLEHDSSGYCGVSWGKDSVCVAHMVALLARDGGPMVPLVWVVVPGCNPDCPAVRDAWLRRYPDHQYEEIHVERGRLRASEVGFAEAARRFGARHVSGVRADESRVRRLRHAKWGHSTERTCAPLSEWSGRDVFAYLHHYDLPVHPAYAMNLHGTLERESLRVASIGGDRGVGMGRREWEERYYPEVVSGFLSRKT